MSERFVRLGLKVGAIAMSLGLAVLTLSAAPQDPPEGAPPPYQGRGFGPGPRMGPFGALGPLGMIVSRLGLSDAQTDQIRGLLQARQAELQALIKNEVLARQALEAAQWAGEPDSTILQLHASLAAVEAEVAVARTHMLTEIQQLLTPEQQTNLKSMRDRMQQRGPGGPGVRQRRQKQDG